MFVDSHAHLTSPEFQADRGEVIARALEAGVRFIVNPAINLEDSKRAIELAERHAAVYACVGVHPHEAGSAGNLAEIEEMSRHPKVVAIGEIGLDFHYDYSPRDVQARVFMDQLEIARRRDLPVVIHTRESTVEAVEIVREMVDASPDWMGRKTPRGERHPPPRGVFHCFPGDLDQAWTVIRLGFYLSFPGILTFKNPGRAREVAGSVSLEHFLIETDSPYMAPVPHRGKRNEPAYLSLIAAKLAELQRLSVPDVARATSHGAHRLFGIGEPPEPQITYTLREALYVNLTIRCNADCVFCDRKGEAIIKGQNLRLEREPTPGEVIQSIADPTRYSEIVFCGYGEPTIRLEALKEIARWVKERGGKTRLNTDGHGSLINRRNIVPELVPLIDAVSISLNSPDPGQYGELMRIDGEKHFAAMIEFARECVRAISEVSMTVVDLEEVNMEEARRLVEEEIGATFIRRPFF